ncbi:hypothetical protein FM106_20830 [Brachybacterium faecium]|nr:hypothetical protein FM106_20830 [Brachybacterium faecium]
MKPHAHLFSKIILLLLSFFFVIFIILILTSLITFGYPTFE